VTGEVEMLRLKSVVGGCLVFIEGTDRGSMRNGVALFGECVSHFVL
jgi:hypothetical protein